MANCNCLSSYQSMVGAFFEKPRDPSLHFNLLSLQGVFVRLKSYQMYFCTSTCPIFYQNAFRMHCEDESEDP